MTAAAWFAHLQRGGDDASLSLRSATVDELAEAGRDYPCSWPREGGDGACDGSGDESAAAVGAPTRFFCSQLSLATMQASIGYIFGSRQAGVDAVARGPRQLLQDYKFQSAAAEAIAKYLPYKASACTPNQVADVANVDRRDGRYAWLQFDLRTWLK